MRPYGRGDHALLLSINGLLPDDIRVTRVRVAPPGFSARFSAVAKRYRYDVVTGPVCDPFRLRHAHHEPLPLDLDAMAAAAADFVGVHDFRAFTVSSGDTAPEARKGALAALLRRRRLTRIRPSIRRCAAH